MRSCKLVERGEGRGICSTAWQTTCQWLWQALKQQRTRKHIRAPSGQLFQESISLPFPLWQRRNRRRAGYTCQLLWACQMVSLLPWLLFLEAWDIPIHCIWNPPMPASAVVGMPSDAKKNLQKGCSHLVHHHGWNSPEGTTGGGTWLANFGSHCLAAMPAHICHWQLCH